MAFDPAKIEGAIDRAVTAGIELDDGALGFQMKTLIDAMEFSKVMALAGQAIPAFMRNQPGICLATVVRAVRWGLDPFFVAEQSYLTKNPKTQEEKLAYMAQLFNAVINRFEPLILEGKLRIRYEGDGLDQFGVVYGTPKRETEPLEYKTPTIGARIKAIGRNDGGYVKGSPLYDQDPEQALWYFGSRAFIRRYFPHVLAGTYTAEELAEAGFQQVQDVTPGAPQVANEKTSLIERLKNKRLTATGAAPGFDPDHANREAGLMSGNGDEGGATRTIDNQETEDHGQENGGKDDAARGNGGEVRERGDDAGGQPDGAQPGGGVDAADGSVGASDAGSGDAQAGQGELIPPEPNAGKRKRSK